MTVFFILWLIPGYITAIAHDSIRPTRNKSGWDFIGRIGFSSLIFYLLSKILLASDFVSCIDAVVSRFLRLDKETSGILTATFLAILYYCILFLIPPFKLLIFRWSLDDPFIKFTHKAVLCKANVLVSLKNGKVYVGRIKDSTMDVNEPLKSIVIVLSMSGYRQSNDHQVIFDKNYAAMDGMNEYDLELLIFTSEIVSIRPFSQKLHVEFVKNGVTLLGATKERIDDK